MFHNIHRWQPTQGVIKAQFDKNTTTATQSSAIIAGADTKLIFKRSWRDEPSAMKTSQKQIKNLSRRICYAMNTSGGKWRWMHAKMINA